MLMSHNPSTDTQSDSPPHLNACRNVQIRPIVVRTVIRPRLALGGERCTAFGLLGGP